MLEQYRCGYLCEMQFISVVCGLAVIQKQPRLVDRAFNKLLPHTFQSLPYRLSSRPLPPFQSPISDCSLSLLLTPLLSLFPYPAFLTQQAALIYTITL